MNRYLFLSIFSIFLITISSCRGNNNITERPEPLPQNSLIQAYFNHNYAQGANYTDPYRQKD
ncbi:hypothetical protein R0J87_20640, partial [Halomonas sp. SIMBA_159]